MAHRDEAWSAFQADPDWIEQRNATEAERVIVNRIENAFLAPTDFSALR